MKTIDDALAFADTFDKPANKYMSIVMLAAEVRRLRGWIRKEGDHNDTCTRQILGEVCHGCKCGKTLPEPAP